MESNLVNTYAVHEVSPTAFDYEYRGILRDCLNAFEEGMTYPSRPGMDCSFVHARQLRCDLRDNFVSALTTKFIPLKKCFYELQWYMLGLTNAKWLQERGVNVWDEWVDHPLNQSHGRASGEMGPIYGHLWRNFGATHMNDVSLTSMEIDKEKRLHLLDRKIQVEVNKHSTYQFLSDGFDQLAAVIKSLRDNPHSRRIILSAWNPKTQDSVVLPPCHTFVQFFACQGELYTSLTCRSTDVLFGLPWNALAYGLLTKILAHASGLEPRELCITMNNCHLYENQIAAAKEHHARVPLTGCRMRIDPDVQQQQPWEYEWSDFCGIQYDHQGKLTNQPDIAV